MARIRTIKPEFWEDEKIGRLPIPCRLFFIGCWNFADDYGVIKGNPALLKSQIFPYDENLRVSEVRKWLNALVEARMLIPIILDDAKQRPAEESYYVIRTFRSHQVLDNRYHKSYISKDEKYVNSLINKVLSNDDVNTTSTQCNDDVNTMEEMEMEMEKEMERYKKGTNVPKENTHAPSERYLSFQTWLKNNCPYIFGHYSNKITEAEFDKLQGRYSSQDIGNVILQIENRIDLRKKYTNLYRTVLNWIKRERNYAKDTGGHEDKRRGYAVTPDVEKDYNSTF